ncbi:MAG TPA: hypothetical protein VNO82_22220, partial [Solirubrobacteraceae bacterium]|nr:hypothetical protein [Solirubrobacteraceae bacterium]
LFRAAPAPLGHDPYAIWPAGPEDPDAGVLRLRPWRIRVLTMETLLGHSEPLVWAAASGGLTPPGVRPLSHG